MSINLNSRNNTLCCKVNDLYTALMASELLNDCVDDVVVMLKTCVDYVNIVSSQEVQIQHARFTMDGEEFRQYVMELDYFAFAKEVVDSYFGEAMQNGRLL